MKIPFINLLPVHGELTQEFENVFKEVIQKSSFINGENLIKFEKEFSSFIKTNHCVGTSNGLNALVLCLKILKIGFGDEVIIPGNTFIATALAVKAVGAIPVLVDIDKKSFNIDPNKIEAKITNKTRAIIPVHLYGQACEMQTISEIAKVYNLHIIEDYAQAQGASYNGKPVGSWGIVNATSFYPGKNLGALGDAGAITTNDYDLYRRIKLLSNYGSERKYEHDEIGMNERLDELQAALLLIKLRKLNNWNSQRAKIANYYTSRLQDCQHIILPEISKNSTHVYHLFVIRVKERKALQDHLHSAGIQTLIHYPKLIHHHKCFQGHFPCTSLPVAESLNKEILSLPIWIGMTEKEVDFITNSILNFYQKK
jgi:dTDP-4-amino-4,6-dideoxygalactose transaminase